MWRTLQVADSCVKFHFHTNTFKLHFGIWNSLWHVENCILDSFNSLDSGLMLQGTSRWPNHDFEAVSCHQLIDWPVLSNDTDGAQLAVDSNGEHTSATTWSRGYNWTRTIIREDRELYIGDYECHWPSSLHSCLPTLN